MDIRESYDSAAEAYAREFGAELGKKPLDRHLLNRFAEGTRRRGLVVDLGCGPGQVARHLRDQGVTVCGVDLSPGMVREAAELHPEIPFEVGDMRDPGWAEASLAGVVAFYAIVHLSDAEIAATLGHIRKALVPGGLAMVAFHVGDREVHVGELCGAPVSLDFRFLDPARVVEALGAAGLPVIVHVEREPYEGAEYPSRRCYLLARAT